jgi:hypothetical protein
MSGAGRNLKNIFPPQVIYLTKVRATRRKTFTKMADYYVTSSRFVRLTKYKDETTTPTGDQEMTTFTIKIETMNGEVKNARVQGADVDDAITTLCQSRTVGNILAAWNSDRVRVL